MKIPSPTRPATHHKQRKQSATGPLAARNRVRRITDKDALKLEAAEIDYRFVREAERLEREGRVRSRLTLEKDLGLSKGTISSIRGGLRGISPAHVKRLKDKYNGDFCYIITGLRDPHGTSGPQRMGKRLDVYTGYTHRYSSPAAWKCGPRPEDDPGHYPDDPENEQHPWRTDGKPEPADVAVEASTNYAEVLAAVEAFEQARAALGGVPPVRYYADTKGPRIDRVELVIEDRRYAISRPYRAVREQWVDLLQGLAAELSNTQITTGVDPSPKARLLRGATVG